MNVKLLLFILCIISVPDVFAKKNCVRVACVGNSITYGTGLADREKDSYPVKLQQLLGDGYMVQNFGKPGATLLSKGHLPYIDQPEYQNALSFVPDIVVIHLGINDTDPRNWPNFRDDFIPDYKSLIASFRAVNPECKIYVARMTPIVHTHPRFESGTRDWHAEIQYAIEIFANHSDAYLIDFYEPLHAYPYMFPDAVHPNEEGAMILAKTVYQSISGNFGGLHMADIWTDNMVLQRNSPLVIKGIANAGSMVTVKIDTLQQTVETPYNGHWEVVFKPLEAGGPYTLSVTTNNKESLVYKNVLVGEVWLCSGQSNMEFYLKDCTTGKEGVVSATNNNIRFYDMKAAWRTDAKEWDINVLDSLNHLQYYRCTGWESATPESAADFSAIAYYFGKMLQDSLNVPVGLICNAVGGSPTEAWIDRSVLEKDFLSVLKDWKHNDFIQPWVRERAQLNIKKSGNSAQRHPYEPCFLFEAGIQSLDRFPVKGVIWYQGESNAHNKDAHARLFELLVSSWRKQWNNDSLPFYYVQLSSLNRPSWPWFRDSQRRLMQEIPHVGMVVSSDKGDSLDVHPRDKKEIGERLAYAALSESYGHDVVPYGPLFDTVVFENQYACINFKYAAGLKTSDGNPVSTFEIAGADLIFYPAKAEIAGEKVKVSSPHVSTPKYVRYGWQPFTRANLINGAGLPASTFIGD